MMKPVSLTVQNKFLHVNVSSNINNFREKFSPGPGFELGSPAVL